MYGQLAYIDFGTVAEYYSTVDFNYTDNDTPMSAESRVIDAGHVEHSQTDLYSGKKSLSPTTVKLDNSDGYFSDILAGGGDPRGKLLKIYTYDVDDALHTITFGSPLSVYVFTIMSCEVDRQYCILTGSVIDTEILEITIPQKRISAELFDDTVDSSALNQPVPIWFGEVPKVPLHSVAEINEPRYYGHFFLIGESPIAGVDAVYRDALQVGAQEYTFFDGTLSVGGNCTSGGIINLIDTGADFINDGVQEGDFITNVDTGETSVIWQLTDTRIYYHITSMFSAGEEYLITNLYPSFSCIAFAWEQRDENSNLYEMRADIRGLKIGGTYTPNPVDCLEEFLTNTDWGLGLTAESTTFAVASALAQPNSWRMGFGMHEFRRAREWIDLILASCKFAHFSRWGTANDEYKIVIPQTVNTIAGTFDDDNMADVVLRLRPQDEMVKEVLLKYNYGLSEDAYLGEQTYSTGLDIGQTKEFYLPFTVSEQMGQSVANYLRNRFKYQNRIIEFMAGEDAIELELNDIITVTYPDLSIDNEMFEIVLIRKQTDNIYIKAYSYSLNIFDEPTD